MLCGCKCCLIGGAAAKELLVACPSPLRHKLGFGAEKGVEFSIAM